MSDSPYNFEYGDYVVCTSADTDMAPIGRVLGAEHIAKTEDDESYLDAWKRAGKPYRVILKGADKPIVANEDALIHIAPIADPIDIERFGDTAESARDFLVELQDKLETSDEWGHTIGGQADPHYWGIMDCLTQVVTDSEHDWEHCEFVFDDANYTDVLEPINAVAHAVNGYTGSDRHAFVEALKRLFSNRFPSEELILEFGDDPDTGDLKDYNVNPDTGISACSLLARNKDTGQHRFLTDEDLSYLLVDYIDRHLCDETGVYLDVDVVYIHDVWGIAPNAMFITKESANAYLKANRHHHHRDAHPYLMTAWRDATVERLWRLLRDVDWSRSTLTMRDGRKLAPDLD